MFRFLLAFVLSIAAALPASAQITIPAETPAYKPIVVVCENKSTKDSEVRIKWRTSSDDVAFLMDSQSNALHVWATPGDHWIEATVATHTFREVVVLVPDPDAPGDLTKAKSEKVKISLAFDIERYKADFKVTGGAPVIPPGPTPAPVPVPTGDLQTIVKPLQAIAAKADATKAALWAGAWSDFYIVMQSSPLPKTKAEFKASLSAFLNAAATRSGLQGAFPGFSVELEKAYVTRFGSEDGALEAMKAQEFVAAIVWACSR